MLYPSRLIVATLASISTLVSALPAYENTAITKTHDLGGSTTFISTAFNVKALTSDASLPYELALGGAADKAPSWWEVVVGGKVVEGLVVNGGDGLSPPTISLPSPLSGSQSSTFSFTLNLIQTHKSRPLPATISQDDEQSLLYESSSLWVESFYETKKEIIKFRAPGKIISHSSAPETYTRDSTSSTKNSLLTLGPYFNVPATVGGATTFEQVGMNIHYPTTEPVLAVRKLKRLVEVSHWGGNLNIEDWVGLFNNGPRLKGFFSRIHFQMAKFRPAYPSQILRSLTLPLPPKATNPYYYDVIGNISTSNFRPSRDGRANSILELRPRYPVLGGWNSTFVVGYDLPLGGYLKCSGEKKTLGVGFLTGLKDVVYDEVEVVVTLPEGARDVQVHTPFTVDSIERAVHKTFLDSTGRPQLILKKKDCTERHDQLFYVTYTYPSWAILQKPITVATACMSLFTVALVLRRIDVRISKATKSV